MQKTRINYALAALIIAIAAAYFIIYCYHGINILRFPFDWEQADGYFAYSAIRLLEGQPLYSPLDNYPLIISPHGPVYPAMVATLMPLLGEPLLAGRLLAFLASLLIGLLIYGIVKVETRNTYLGALSALLFFASNVTYELAASFRPDMLALSFCLAGVFIARRYQDSPKVYLAVIPLLLAVFTKHTYIAASVAVVIFFLLTNKKVAAKIALALLFCGGSIFLLLNFLTDGEFFKHLFVYSSGFEPSYRHWLLLNSYFLSTHPVLLGFAATYLWLSIWRRQLSVWGIYFLVSLALVTFAVQYQTLGFYYYLETVVLCSILTGLCLNKLLTKLKSYPSKEWITVLKDLIIVSKGLITASLLCLLLIQLGLFIHFPPSFDPHTITLHCGQTPTAADLKVMEEVNQYVRNTKGKVFTEELVFALQNNKEVWIDANYLRTIKHPEAKAALERFQADLENRKFSLIVLSYRLFTPDIGQAIQSNYLLTKEIPTTTLRYQIYVPMPTTLFPLAEFKNGSFESWVTSPEGLFSPEHWGYSQGGEGGFVEKCTADDVVKDGSASVRLSPSSGGNSMLRYEISDTEGLRGGFILFSVWVKSQNTAPHAIQLDVQDLIGAPLAQSYINSGGWEQIVVQMGIDAHAERILLTINVRDSANDGAYFDGATLMVIKD